VWLGPARKYHECGKRRERSCFQRRSVERMKERKKEERERERGRNAGGRESKEGRVNYHLRKSNLIDHQSSTSLRNP
jgi:hypothetical protein